MAIVQAFRTLHKHMYLLAIPIVFDLVALVVGLRIVGFYGTSTISIRIPLEMGLPSISHLLNIPIFANSVDFLQNADEPNLVILLVIGISVIVSAFFQGGYVSGLWTAVQDKKMSVADFVKNGKRYWMQFILLEVIFFLGKILLTTFLVFFFQVIGVGAAFIFFIVFRILVIYLEFTIVVDHISIDKAIKKSYSYFKQSVIPTMIVIVLMYMVTSGISFITHWLWAPWIIVGAILVNGFLMSGIQLMFMANLLEIKRNN